MNKLIKKIRNFFVPHSENEFLPHFLRHESMMLSLLLVLIIELGFLVQVFVVFDNSKFLAQVLPGVLTSLTNEQRQENNLPELKVSEVLTRAATMKANDMASKGYFAHTSPEGRTPWYWFDQVGYDYTYAGENLAVNFFESEDVAIAWMNSPTHRANIVKKDYTEIGIGVAKGVYEGRESVFVAQLFGTPATSFPTNVTEVLKTQPAKKTPAKPSVKKSPTPAPKPVVTTKTANISKSPEPTDSKVLSEESTSSSATLNKVFKPNTSVKDFFDRLLSSPRESVKYMYSTFAMLIAFVAVTVMFVRYERRHSYGILRGLVVIAVIGSILYINSSIASTTETRLPTDSQSASVILAE